MSEQFNYSYAAKEHEEVEKIKAKYIAKEESKMDKLRRLDKQAEKPGQIASLALGIVGTLILGAGMSIVMEFAASPSFFVVGVVIGIVGIITLAFAYPVYLSITKKQRALIADEIIALSMEISLK